MAKKRKVLEGNVFTNNKGLSYKVMSEIDDHCVVKFDTSGATVTVKRERVVRGGIRDPSYRKSKYGSKDLVIGCILQGKYGEEFEVVEAVAHKTCQGFYLIRFLKSGNKTVVCREKILRGCVCDLDAVIYEKELKHINGRVFIAISPDGNQYVSDNQINFAKEHGLEQGNISGCLTERIQTHKGWKFKYVTDLVKLASM